MKFSSICKNKNIVMLHAFVVFFLLQFAVVYATGVYKNIYEGSTYPTRLLVVSGIVVVAELVFIIVSRIKKKDVVLRGYFLFKLVGCIAFVICLFMRMAGNELTGTFFGYIYSVLTVTVRPLSYLITPFVGVSEFFRKALIHVLITYFAGAAYMGIKKQEKFEKELEEKHEMQEQSLKRTENGGLY